MSQFIYRNVNKVLDKILVSHRKKQINNTDFSIICNNCWGGYVYRRFGLPYYSPLVGLYLFPEDFLKLCTDVKGYMGKELEFISYTESRYRDEIEKRQQAGVPIARLGDIEIIFLHYKTREEAADKWKRRAARINYDNLIFKFSKMDGCTDEQLLRFDQFDFDKKICFVPVSHEGIRCGILFKSATGTEVHKDTGEYARYVDLVRLINAKKACGNHVEGVWC